MSEEIPPLPDKFRETISDFANDLSLTFPEFSILWSVWSDPNTTDMEFKQLFLHCLSVYPERFFDIIHQNEDIFAETSEVNTYFLPNVEFKQLYHCEGVSPKTREVIWKYLQVILFLLVGSVQDKINFGEAMNMFDNMNQGDLHEKLKDVMTGVSDFFSTMEQNLNTSAKRERKAKQSTSENDSDDKKSEDDSDSESEEEEEGASPFDPKKMGLPNPEDLYNHLQGLFNGKIGGLAKEIAEDIGQDIADSFGDDIENVKSTKDVLSKLMQNPERIGGLVKSVGEKINQKMESGDISRDDIMSEAGDLMRKMKEMGGADQFTNMFKSMAKGMGVPMPKGAQINTNALVQMEKTMNARDRLKARAQAKQQQKLIQQMMEQAKMQQQVEEYQKFISTTEGQSFLLQTQTPNYYNYEIDGVEKQERSVAPPSSGEEKISASKKKRMKQKAKKQATDAAETETDVSVSSK
jgi:hypothetical protein